MQAAPPRKSSHKGCTIVSAYSRSSVCSCGKLHSAWATAVPPSAPSSLNLHTVDGEGRRREREGADCSARDVSARTETHAITVAAVANAGAVAGIGAVTVIKNVTARHNATRRR